MLCYAILLRIEVLGSIGLPIMSNTLYWCIFSGFPLSKIMHFWGNCKSLKMSACGQFDLFSSYALLSYPLGPPVPFASYFEPEVTLDDGVLRTSSPSPLALAVRWSLGPLLCSRCPWCQSRPPGSLRWSLLDPSTSVLGCQPVWTATSSQQTYY